MPAPPLLERGQGSMDSNHFSGALHVPPYRELARRSRRHPRPAKSPLVPRLRRDSGAVPAHSCPGAWPGWPVATCSSASGEKTPAPVWCRRTPGIAEIFAKQRGGPRTRRGAVRRIRSFGSVRASSGSPRCPQWPRDARDPWVRGTVESRPIRVWSSAAWRLPIVGRCVESRSRQRCVNIRRRRRHCSSDAVFCTGCWDRAYWWATRRSIGNGGTAIPGRAACGPEWSAIHWGSGGWLVPLWSVGVPGDYESEDCLRPPDVEAGAAQQHRAILDAIPAIAWSKLPDDSSEFVNQRWQDFTGISADQARAGVASARSSRRPSEVDRPVGRNCGIGPRRGARKTSSSPRRRVSLGPRPDRGGPRWRGPPRADRRVLGLRAPEVPGATA